ncbi:RagB/SusD family nutrient uptake outer membrane protein [Pedobacter hiemivivus]|uniref:RagB/SusD family nutrient uptake outer membrane protein n=1 Tax=Pedobacter hiemivivus TaxID=2530454 RepID=A0A4R0NDT2_9SPHI|nr:RagB/SusD family nutrient uptake outer membrane protein [Pedobacter hiemivivus]TCC98550.1 RagB/SusD family nutrient uptake outer membrane protein [Pedobacter hiemivivus]
MKKLQYIICSILIMQLFLISACRKDFLDKSPDEDITIEEAFKQRKYAEAFLVDIYAGLPNEIYFTDMVDVNPFIVASDEMNIPWPEKFPKLMNKGAWNSFNVAGQIYKNMYEGIRKANIFLEHIHITPLSAEFTQTTKDRWIGEATFLRAFYHFQVMRIYGPVPIMDYSAGVADDFTKIRRKPLDQCVKFVVDECDKAITLLPMNVVQTRDIGRPTAAATLALKARVLLYNASPLWNGNPDYRSFADNEGTKLFPQQYDENKWDLAAAAAKDCITKCESAGYHLFKNYADPVKNYQQLFIENNNPEVLFARNSGRDGWMEKCAFPGSLGGWDGWNPTQGQIDAYEMDNGMAPITGYSTDGSPIINAASGYVETGYAAGNEPTGKWLDGTRNMYLRRDPRFYATINFNGAYFVDRRVQFWKSGADGMGGDGRDYNTTGYLLKKFIDPGVSLTEQRYSLKTWIFFRLGEMYLNYAEALNEADGATSDVYKAVNAIRDRAGMPFLPVSLTKEEMRTRIRNERRVELAFETHRYFDCHRWKIAEQTDKARVYGMNVAAGTSLKDDDFYKRTLIETRVFQTPKHYLFPIPQDEIDKNPSIAQNPGW